MGDWTIGYSTKELGIASHGVISVRDPTGTIVQSYEGLAVAPNGVRGAIGLSTLNRIEAVVIPGVSPNYDPTLPSQTLFSGPRTEVEAMMAAATLAAKEINALEIGYPVIGLFSTSTSLGISNSNAVIETLAVAMGLQPPLSITKPIPGQGVLLLSKEKLLEIRAATWDKPGSSLEVHCFLADTPILMADGSEKPIQDVRPDDLVTGWYRSMTGRICRIGSPGFATRTRRRR